MFDLRRRVLVYSSAVLDGFVDLGLPSGALWAKGNLVKDSQENYSIGNETDYGVFLSWGNIVGYNESRGYNFSSTNYNSTPGASMTSNIKANDAEHDIIVARLGGDMHLPSYDDIMELSNNTDFEWVSDYKGSGVAGCKFMKKTNNSVYIFVPASGYFDGTTRNTLGTYATFWTNSIYNDTRRYDFYKSSSSAYYGYGKGQLGFPARAIVHPCYNITITVEGENIEGITITVTDSGNISHSGTTDSNGVVQLTGVASGSAKVFTKDYYVTNSRIIVNASSRTFTCGLEQRESKYLTFYSITNCTHKFTKAVNYSLDGGTTWQSLAANTDLTVTAGNSVMWKATLSPSSSRGIGTFSVTADTMRFNVEGNPMSLLYGDNFIGQTDLTNKDYAFYRLFGGNTSVVDAHNMALPATTLASCCYNSMFYGCTLLTKAPKLPATTLTDSCYSYMFHSCKLLTEAPELLAITLTDHCYYDMFYNCSSLNYIKCMATGINGTVHTGGWVDGVAASGTFVKAFNMTDWPTSTSGIPSGWTVKNDGEGLLTFESLEDNNEIRWYKTSSATSKTIYFAKENGAPTSVTPSTSGTVLTTLNTGEKLYVWGSNSNYASSSSNFCYFRSSANYKVYGNIMSLVSSRNYFSSNYALAALFYNDTHLIDASGLLLPVTNIGSYSYVYYCMFQGCTGLTAAPELPATTLYSYCYAYMFYNCTSLTTAPVLPATTLASGCYRGMFQGCSSLNYVKAMFTTTPSTSYTNEWLSGVAATGTFVKNAIATWNVSGVTGIPDGWTVQNA